MMESEPDPGAEPRAPEVQDGATDDLGRIGAARGDSDRAANGDRQLSDSAANAALPRHRSPSGGRYDGRIQRSPSPGSRMRSRSPVMRGAGRRSRSPPGRSSRSPDPPMGARRSRSPMDMRRSPMRSRSPMGRRSRSPPMRSYQGGGGGGGGGSGSRAIVPGPPVNRSQAQGQQQRPKGGPLPPCFFFQQGKCRSESDREPPCEANSGVSPSDHTRLLSACSSCSWPMLSHLLHPCARTRPPLRR